MSRMNSREKRPARGQSLLEFALALPVLLILFLGLIEVALVLRSQLVLTNANREAARYASRGIYTDAQVAERALASFAGQLPVDVSSESANTSIIITRFHIPVVPATGVDEPTRFPVYITGTFAYTDDNQVLTTKSKLPAKHLDTLVQGNANYPTDHDLVYVETYYDHHQLLNAPLISRFIPKSIVLYVRTAMRVSAPKAVE